MIIFLLIYIVTISVFAIIAIANDKFKASRRKRYNRIPESTLLTIAFLGGATAMFMTMLVTHHKTRKPKFMVGLPLIIALHIIIVFVSVKTGAL